MPLRKTDFPVSLESLSARKSRERRKTASAIRTGKATRHEMQLRNAPYSESKIRVSKLFGA